jgi:hypothetical protein
MNAAILFRKNPRRDIFISESIMNENRRDLVYDRPSRRCPALRLVLPLRTTVEAWFKIARQSQTRCDDLEAWAENLNNRPSMFQNN